MLTNTAGRPGDALVLTKPLGVGALSTAAKRGVVDDGGLEAAIETMVALNDRAAAQAVAAGARAATDVTGFGLLGHLHNLARESGVGAVVDAAAVEVLPRALELLAGDDGVSGGLVRNAQWAEAFTTFDEAVPDPVRRLLCDPVTSGGLLIAIAPGRAGEIEGAVVGELRAGPPGTITVR
jgi:selenide,water dikinase